MSSHCSRYPTCKCPADMGIACHIPDDVIAAAVALATISKGSVKIVHIDGSKDIQGSMPSAKPVAIKTGYGFVLNKKRKKR